ncbi:B3 domain-containing protein REM9 [Euphorbia peplus]|nr:B3 domain-containing protein REM9 [Euphorbia peplus]
MSEQPHYFKPLIPGFEDEFLIPSPFLKYLNGQECQLRTRCGKTWVVKINGRRFEKGWKEFVEDHDLQIGDFLVFRYEGEMLFDVLVFDRTTCEREYFSGMKDEEFDDGIRPECIGNGKQLEEKKKAETRLIENDSSFSTVDVTEPCDRKELEEKKKAETRLIENDSSSALEHPYCKIKLSLDSLRKSRLYIPQDFARLCSLYGRSCSMVLKDEEENCWPAKLLYRANDSKFIIGDGWGEFHGFHKLRAGDTLMIELIKNGETPVMKICRVREHPEVTRELTFQNNAELDSSLLRQIHADTENSELRKSQPKTPELAKESSSSKIIFGTGKFKGIGCQS